MKPSDFLIQELTEFEKDLSRAKRNSGMIYSSSAIVELEKKIAEFKRAISVLASSKL